MKRFDGIVAFGLTLAVVAFAVDAPASAATGKAYFKGKTIIYIVATAAGGGHDFYARLMAHHMKRYLPGTKIAVINRPGAGHRIGTNLI